MDAIQKASQTWGGKRNPGALNGKKKKTTENDYIRIYLQLVTLITYCPSLQVSTLKLRAMFKE